MGNVGLVLCVNDCSAGGFVRVVTAVCSDQEPNFCFFATFLLFSQIICCYYKMSKNMRVTLKNWLHLGGETLQVWVNSATLWKEASSAGCHQV